MNLQSWIVWGFVATVAITTLEGAAQGLRLTRMNLLLLIGSAFTPDRDRARYIGALTHFAFGWVFSLVYLAVFQELRWCTWWLGGIAGLVHGLFVLTVVFPAVPGFHPRVASERQGPTATRHLEPPGFMGLNYGVQTPLTVLITHAAFGAILGAFYHMR